jgi:hypothetical protein
LVSGKAVGVLEPLGYVESDVPPGEITLAARWTEIFTQGAIDSQASQVVVAQPGTTSYFRLKMAAGPLAAAHRLTLEPVTVAIGESEAATTRLSEVVERGHSEDLNKSENATSIIILRQYNFYGSAVIPRVFVNGHSIGDLSGNGELTVTVPNGENTVGIRWSGRESLFTSGMSTPTYVCDGQRMLVIQTGEFDKRFIEASIGVEDISGPVMRLSEISAESAQKVFDAKQTKTKKGDVHQSP